MGINAPVDWNAVAQQYGIVNRGAKPGAGNVAQQVSAPSFSGAPRELNYDQFVSTNKSSGVGVTATLVGLTAATAAIVAARKGKILKSGKFGGSVGDWIRNFKLSNLKFWGKTAKNKSRVIKPSKDALLKAQTTFDDLTKRVEYSQKRIAALNISLNGTETQTLKRDKEAFKKIAAKYNIPESAAQIKEEILKEKGRIEGLNKGIEKQIEIIKANR